MVNKRRSRSRGTASKEHMRRLRAPCEREPRVMPRPVRDRLHELVRNLRLARCALLISAQVLEAQNADADADVAHLLRHDIGARLDVEIDGAEALLTTYGKRTAARPPPPPEGEMP